MNATNGLQPALTADEETAQQYAQRIADTEGVPIDLYEQPVAGQTFGHPWYTADVSEDDRRYCTEVRKWKLLASAVPNVAIMAPE